MNLPTLTLRDGWICMDGAQIARVHRIMRKLHVTRDGMKLGPFDDDRAAILGYARALDLHEGEDFQMEPIEGVRHERHAD